MKLIPSRAAQYVMDAEFTFRFDDTMRDVVDGVVKDFGKTNTSLSVFEVINLPEGAVVISGEFVTEVAFTGALTLSLGDEANPARYLASANRGAAGRVAITPTGYVSSGENVRMTVTPAAASAGRATARVQYVIPGRQNETNPN